MPEFERNDLVMVRSRKSQLGLFPHHIPDSGPHYVRHVVVPGKLYMLRIPGRLRRNCIYEINQLYHYEPDISTLPPPVPWNPNNFTIREISNHAFCDLFFEMQYCVRFTNLPDDFFDWVFAPRFASIPQMLLDYKAVHGIDDGVAIPPPPAAVDDNEDDDEDMDTPLEQQSATIANTIDLTGSDD
ncbi:hypothetical protein FA13DRAFT_1791662 [Coprinellus micaceus]|uniref:Uncharacterized protein n=1 Tax=Coprinellus micaceus TaxID=71717 RepID=A0A4Y7TCZ6_COPMI|nr:hypothetical protein FA13DRAFT_1791662 [Coprinellus micaceus]